MAFNITTNYKLANLQSVNSSISMIASFGMGAEIVTLTGPSYKTFADLNFLMHESVLLEPLFLPVPEKPELDTCDLDKEGLLDTVGGDSIWFDSGGFDPVGLGSADPDSVGWKSSVSDIPLPLSGLETYGPPSPTSDPSPL